MPSKGNRRSWKKKSDKIRMKSLRAAKLIKQMLNSTEEKGAEPSDIVDRILVGQTVFPAPECIIKQEQNELEVQNGDETASASTEDNSQELSIAEVLVKEEIEIEEFSVPENVEDPLTISTELISKPVQQSAWTQVEKDLPDIVFTFEDRLCQPTQKELRRWLRDKMFHNRPDILQNIQMIKIMNGCFIIQVKKYQMKSNQKTYHRRGIFTQIEQSFNNSRNLQINKWRIERFDIVPESWKWISVFNLPTWVTHKDIVNELSRFGRVLKVVIRTLITELKQYEVFNGDIYVRMHVSKHIPTDLVICGCIAWIKYCDCPIAS